MILNELAQWALLLTLAVFVLGLTRQLGVFLMPSRRGADPEMGPATGQEVPSTLLSREEKAQIAAAMHDRSQDHAVILVVDEMCPTCEQVLDDLDRTRVRDDAPLVIVARRSTEPHAARLARLGDIAIVDARRLEKSELRWTPFVIVLDSELRVVYKALASTVERAVIRWRASDGEAGTEAIVLQTVAGKET